MKEFQGFEVPASGASSPSCTTSSTSPTTGSTRWRASCIGTIQRLYSMLRGDAELDRGARRGSRATSVAPDRPVEVDYNPALPIETFDVIIVDECHRSIYGVWRQVLEYFDAFLDRADRHARASRPSGSSTRTW